MGIPLGWNIARDEPKAKDVLRADVTGSRSPIRRRARASRAPRSLTAFDTDALVDVRSSRFAHMLEHAPRLSHARTQLPPAPPVPGVRDGDDDGDADGPGHGDGDERPLPALTPGFAPAGPRSPSRYVEAEAGDRARLLAAGRRPEELDWSALPSAARLPRPPPSASRRRIELDDFVDGAPRPPPARILSWASGRRRHPTAPRRSDSSPYASDDEPTAAATDNPVAHPPLRRVGHRRIADGPLPSSSLRESWSPVSTLDGLGDRERSNSVSSTSSNLPWQTFLSTVVPDPVAPTAESSFASAAASASFTASSSRASSSNSNSAASERTNLTVPSRRASRGPARSYGEDMAESFARACESSDEGESTASDTDDEAAANPLSRRRMRPSYFADEPPSPRRYGRNVVDTGVDARRYVRSYYLDATSRGILYELDTRDPQVDGPVDGPLDGPADPAEEQPEQDSFATVDDEAASTIPASPLDQELRDARSLLERLTRRGDVGDDFWASVGLTRSFADGVERVERVHDRGRF